MQVQSPVDSATMSPVERTAAWVLNNGQYEEDVEETEQNQDEAKHAEKVGCSLRLLTYCPHSDRPPTGSSSQESDLPNFSFTSYVNPSMQIRVYYFSSGCM